MLVTVVSIFVVKIVGFNALPNVFVSECLSLITDSNVSRRCKVTLSSNFDLSETQLLCAVTGGDVIRKLIFIYCVH